MGENSTGQSVPDKPFLFDDVYRAEWREIYQRRKETFAEKPPPDLVGLAFSGGGIRSATICLGALQALDALKLLPIFDYLSTVSGGGYVGGWWSAWLSRTQVLAKIPAKNVPAELLPGA